jgi:hypothetical protein
MDYKLAFFCAQTNITLLFNIVPMQSYIVGLVCNRNVTNSTDMVKEAIRFNCDQLRSVETEDPSVQKEKKQRILRYQKKF